MKSYLKTWKVVALFIFTVLISTQCEQAGQSAPPEQTWQDMLEQTLGAYGHRNWIVIADAAYPSQSAPGIATVVTGEEHREVIETVLRLIEKAPHVSPVIMLDAEMAYVDEAQVAGMDDFRAILKDLLKGYDAKTMEHEQIISKLDEASKLFNITILKTQMTMPYTSVFIRLDCGYWGPEEESQMREVMNVNPDR